MSSCGSTAGIDVAPLVNEIVNDALFHSHMSRAVRSVDSECTQNVRVDVARGKDHDQQNLSKIIISISQLHKTKSLES